MTDKDIDINALIRHCSTFREVYIDLFAGAGGVSHGIEQAVDLSGTRIAVVAACVNHDYFAIQSHRANVSKALHLNEDIRSVDLSLIVYIVNAIRVLNPGVCIVLWASIECVDHSIAKGGRQRDPDSRTLADDLIRYIVSINPDKIWIENVKEFLQWGPLIPKISFIRLKDGTIAEFCPLVWSKKKQSLEPWLIPDSTRRGEDFDRWVSVIISYGYSSDKRVLNCADYGCPTIRKRLFIQFVKKGNVLRWPVPTHSFDGSENTRRWLPIKDCIDLANTGQSVFKNSRIKSPATFDRLFDGVLSHCVGYLQSSTLQFIDVQYGNGFTRSIALPATTLTTKDRLSLVTVQFGNGSGITQIDAAFPALSRLKVLASALSIVDIKVRQLNAIELKRITTLPESYILLGGSTRAKKFIGNAVPSEMVKALVEAPYNHF